MAKTSIEWATDVWNPVTGCTKVSQGCKNCYAERMAFRLKEMGQANYYNGFEVTLHPHMLKLPSHWRKPRRVFVNSMSDLFHEDVPDEFIWRVFDEMTRGNRRHTYMIMTKRPERMKAWFDTYQERFWHYPKPGKDMQYVKAPWPDPCIWLGVSCEDQKAADKRIPLLLQTPAAVRFVSVEPMLGPVDLGRAYPCGYYCDETVGHVDHPFWRPGIQSKIDWVICGGESGPHARPIDVNWIHSLKDQCDVAGVPIFIKQMGSAWAKENHTPDSKGEDWDYWPNDLKIREFPNDQR